MPSFPAPAAGRILLLMHFMDEIFTGDMTAGQRKINFNFQNFYA